MTLDRTRDLLQTQIGFGGGYSRQGLRLILAEVAREYSHESVNGLIRGPELDRVFGIMPGTLFAVKRP